MILPVLLLFLCACSGSERVMETGFLQKRKHLPGWDLSVGRNDRVRDRMVVERSKDRPEATVHADVEVAATEQATASIGTIAEERNDPKVTTSLPVSAVRTIEEQKPDPIRTTMDQEEQEVPKKKWNKFAIPAFLAALATLYLGFFGTSTIAVIIALVVTFTLSGISLRQIRSRDEAGKGFALSALMIGVIAAIATAIVTYAIGFI